MTNNKLITAAILLTAASTVSGGAVSLTLENYKSEMEGKNVFIKFQAPWWGHCKSMKPAWDSLGDEFADSSSVLIGDVDCTADGKEFCEKHGVSGYPTVKYFKDGDIDEGESYDQARDFDTLKSFVEESLQVKCLIIDPTGCDEKEQGYIEKMTAKGKEERTKQLTRLDGMKGQTMAPANKKWLMQRLGVLKQFEAENNGEL